MLLWLSLFLALPPTLAQSLARFAAGPWQAQFQQVFVPGGFEQGLVETGTLALAPPHRLRFDYHTPPPRTFAVDGQLARMVDTAARTCQAFPLSQSDWARLPLAVLADPQGLEQVFQVQPQDDRWLLTPKESWPELKGVELQLDPQGMPKHLVVVDENGNRNQFSFSTWKRVSSFPEGFFAPALPGQAPCAPGGP